MRSCRSSAHSCADSSAYSLTSSTRCEREEYPSSVISLVVTRVVDGGGWWWMVVVVVGGGW